mmetsp:Transcript_28184/g.90619  ORF Transcript_28184/g.90619 Transcript_28184/m.90619 type:complete len:216 (+) Transcript_28184:632-1279(+)
MRTSMRCCRARAWRPTLVPPRRSHTTRSGTTRSSTSSAWTLPSCPSPSRARRRRWTKRRPTSWTASTGSRGTVAASPRTARRTSPTTWGRDRIRSRATTAIGTSTTPTSESRGSRARRSLPSRGLRTTPHATLATRGGMPGACASWPARLRTPPSRRRRGRRSSKLSRRLRLPRPPKGRGDGAASAHTWAFCAVTAWCGRTARQKRIRRGAQASA